MQKTVRTIAATLVAALVLITVGQTLLAQGRNRPAGGAGGVPVWTNDMVSNDLSARTGKELKPIALVGARNGDFSAKIVVESGGAVSGLRASAGALSGPAGAIPAQNVRLRYATVWDTQGNLWPTDPDILLDAPPAAVPAGRAGRAMLTVWVTVHVPKDAKPGTYAGEVAVQPPGAEAVRAPLKIDVQNWTLPDPQNYRTWLDFVESPDTLALEYNVPLWSDKHWALIDRSFKVLGPTGGRVVYVPLICRTNFGNEQSMVRWIPKGGNQYAYDFTVMDKYLDSAEKNLGKPKLVIFQVWDICMSLQSLTRGLWSGNQGGQDVRQAREELLGKGPRVTVLDAATKEAKVVTLPRYEDRASRDLWPPMFAELRKRMTKRGLADQNLMLGLMPDLWPNKDEVAFWRDVSGGLAWAIHGHAGAASDVDPGKKGLYGISAIGYAAFVYNLVFNVNPAKGRLYGWQNKALLGHYMRLGDINIASAVDLREALAFDITGGQRGVGRIGADLWPVLKSKRGQRSGAVYSRYPENNWRNLDIADWLLAPGPDGAVATARLEYLMEGLQECEARIFLEDALLTPQKKAALSADLAKRAQDVLDEHQRAMWKTVWTSDADLDTLGKIGEGRNPREAVWMMLAKPNKLPDFWSAAGHAMRDEEARKGQEWFKQGWLDREKKLFALAGEVAARLGQK